MALFHIETDKGKLLYETEGCRLTWEGGERVDLSRFAYDYVPGVPGPGQIAFSPDNPVVGKSRSPKFLKIQLGLGCNYSCSYCSQGRQTADTSSTRDAATFLENLNWLEGSPAKIEFWGGEPMLYFKKIEILAPALRKRFPDARMPLVTNGSLLDYHKAKFLYDLGFFLVISHDGPGQDLRGKDPFDDPDWVETIRAIFMLFGERISFNLVLTPKNTDLLENLLWFERRMGFPVKINVENVVTDYGDANWNEDDIRRLIGTVRNGVSTGLALMFPRVRWAVQQFMETLAVEKPLTGSHQGCSMDRQDSLAVDLHGNVLTCQNAGAKSGHKIGTTQDLGAVLLNTSKSWASRKDCPTCPVVHLCYGSCMFIDGKQFDTSCHASYSYNRAILEGVIYLLTGAKVISIDHARRPRRVIPIKEVTL